MPELPAQLPRDLAERARFATLGDGVPALLAHPDWQKPAPFVLWIHGRTATKELDPGRYLRWIRAGFAACAIDLPGHGERFDVLAQDGLRSLDVIAQAVGELDAVLTSLRDPSFAGCFDLSRAGIGGMSMGGMVTLLRLCSPHPPSLPRGFLAASLEATTGWLDGLYFPAKWNIPGAQRWMVNHPEERVRTVDPAAHLDGFTPLPILAVHSEADQLIPWHTQQEFLTRLRSHYESRGTDPAIIEQLTWPSTGAPLEHMGFGKMSNEAKNAQTAFFVKHLFA